MTTSMRMSGRHGRPGCMTGPDKTSQTKGVRADLEDFLRKAWPQDDCFARARGRFAAMISASVTGL